MRRFLPVLLLLSLSVEQGFSQQTWTLRSDLPSNGTAERIYWLGDHFAAIDGLGNLFFSNDGKSWQRNDAASRLGIGFIFKGPEGYASLGIHGHLLHSRDGFAWREGAPYPRPMQGAVWTGKLYAAGWWRGFWSSYDGITWTQRQEMGEGDEFISIVWNGKHLLSPFTGGTGYRSEDGLEWENFGFPTYRAFLDLIWTGSITFGRDWRGVIYSSSDGIQWDSLSSLSEGFITPLIWTGSRLATLHDDTAFTSRDGKSWTKKPRSAVPRPVSIGYPGLDFALIGKHGDYSLSQEGEFWDRVPVKSARPDWRSVVFASNRLVAVGDSGAIATSPDGLSWHARASGTRKNLKKVAWSGTLAVALGDDVLLSSPDGETWTPASLPEGTDTLNSLAFTGHTWVAVGHHGTLLTSGNGKDWTRRAAQSEDKLLQVFSNGKITVITGPLFQGAPYSSTYSGTFIYTSVDGLQWTRNKSDTLIGIGQAVWDGNRFISRFGSRIVTSADGLQWFVSRDSGSFSPELLYAGGRFLGVGGGGDLRISPDVKNWQVLQTRSPVRLNAVAWTGTRFVAVGEKGIILTAPDEGIGSLRLVRRPPAKPASRVLGNRLLFSRPSAIKGHSEGGKAAVTLSTVAGRKVRIP